MALEKPGELREFFSPTLWPPWTTNKLIIVHQSAQWRRNLACIKWYTNIQRLACCLTKLCYNYDGRWNCLTWMYLCTREQEASSNESTCWRWGLLLLCVFFLCFHSFDAVCWASEAGPPFFRQIPWHNLWNSVALFSPNTLLSTASRHCCINWQHF